MWCEKRDSPSHPSRHLRNCFGFLVLVWTCEVRGFQGFRVLQVPKESPMLSCKKLKFVFFALLLLLSYKQTILTK